MKKTWLFQSTGIELVRSNWTDGRASLPNGWQSLERPRISFPKSVLAFGTHDRPDIIAPGRAIALDAYREHGVRRIDLSAGQSIWIGMDPQVFDELTGDQVRGHLRAKHKTNGRACLLVDPRITVSLAIIVEQAESGLADDLDCESMLYEIVEFLCHDNSWRASDARRNAPSPKRGVYEEAVAYAIHLINSDPKRTLSELGRAVHLSPHHFCRVFKRYTGMTIHQYRYQWRVASAVQLIKHTDDPLVKVAADLSFADQSHMTRSIRDALGVTPSKIRSDPSVLRTILQDES